MHIIHVSARKMLEADWWKFDITHCSVDENRITTAGSVGYQSYHLDATWSHALFHINVTIVGFTLPFSMQEFFFYYMIQVVKCARSARWRTSHLSTSSALS